MVNKIFIFDVDGTLTKPREHITADHEARFLAAMEGQIYFIVSGSDGKKIREQVGKKIFNNAFGVFSCMGNEFWQKSKVITRHKAKFPRELIANLKIILKYSKYKTRTGNHIELRPAGTINFSIVGRNATPSERKKYSKYDDAKRERKTIVELLSKTYPLYDFSAGGQISIDITEKGRDKGQILKYVRETLKLVNLPIYFFGDKVSYCGNDGPLAEVLDLERFDTGLPNNWYNVNSPEQTIKLLE